jgi:hypothetical protein
VIDRATAFATLRTPPKKDPQREVNEDRAKVRRENPKTPPPLLNVPAKRGASARVLDTPVCWKSTQGIRRDTKAKLLQPVLQALQRWRLIVVRGRSRLKGCQTLSSVLAIPRLKLNP